MAQDQVRWALVEGSDHKLRDQNCRIELCQRPLTKRAYHPGTKRALATCLKRAIPARSHMVCTREDSANALLYTPVGILPVPLEGRAEDPPLELPT